MLDKGLFLLQEMLPEVYINCIEYAANGKPYFVNASIHFSVSHCNGFAACVISEEGPVGIDIELIQDRIKKVADIKEDYAYSNEYLQMYLALRSKSFEMDLNHNEYKFEYCPTATFENYKNWNVLLKEIISI